MKKLLVILCIIPMLTFIGCIVEEQATQNEDPHAQVSSYQDPTPNSQAGPGDQSSSSTVVDTLAKVSGIKGMVTDENGFPLKGVIISITPNSPDTWNAKNGLGKIACGAMPLARTTVPIEKLQVACIVEPLAYDTTDTKGQFEFDMKDGDYILHGEYTLWENDIPASFGVIDYVTVTAGQSFYKLLVFNIQPIFCTEEYAPVCANGVTYSNSCFAKASGATTWTNGVCTPVEPGCAVIDCVQGYMCVEDTHAHCIPVTPVSRCATMDCVAGYRCVEDDTTARCIPMDTIPACPKNYSPVCASGINFDNECFARAKGYSEFTEGYCTSQRTCYTKENCNAGELCITPDIAYCDSEVQPDGSIITCTMPAPIGVCVALPDAQK